jgi:hypothetical protein
VAQTETPPLVDLELERVVLDCVISAPAQVPVVRSLVAPRAFYYEQHRAIYEVALALHDSGAQPDVVTMSSVLEANGAPRHGLSWQATVADLLGAAPVWSNAGRYAVQLATLATRRRIALLARNLAADPTNGELQTQLAAALAEPPPMPAGATFALDLDEFIADRSELPAALIGGDDDVLLPTAGLLLEFAKGGRGKTTLTLELAFHCASAVSWLGFPIRRALRVLFIENEGPRESFRAKLERKRRSWPHPILGALKFQTMAWGALSLQDPGHLEHLRRYVEGERIDLVIGDPLDSLGLAGVGSPQDTREFMQLLARVGLFTDVAFILLAHPRKELTADELDEIAGAWGGRPDTMLRLAKLDGSRARLSFPKFRWSRESEHPAFILSFDAATDSFSFVAKEHAGPAERDVAGEIRALLQRNPWRTATEISRPTEEGGIGLRRPVVQAILEQPDSGFVQQPGSVVGRHPNAVCWATTTADHLRLVPPPDKTGQDA